MWANSSWGHCCVFYVCTYPCSTHRLSSWGCVSSNMIDSFSCLFSAILGWDLRKEPTSYAILKSFWNENVSSFVHYWVSAWTNNCTINPQCGRNSICNEPLSQNHCWMWTGLKRSQILTSNNSHNLTLCPRVGKWCFTKWIVLTVHYCFQCKGMCLVCYILSVRHIQLPWTNILDRKGSGTSRHLAWGKNSS